jgi:hypothetical protein
VVTGVLPWAVSIAVALVVFLISDPHVYRNPLRNTAHLFSDRVTEMRLMRTHYSAFAAPDFSSQTWYVLTGSLVRGMVGGPPARDEDFGTLPLASSTGLPLIVPFVLVGIGTLFVASRRYWRRTRRLSAEVLILVTTAVYLVGTCLTLGMYVERYLLPTLYLVIVLAALGASALIHQALARVTASRHAHDTTGNSSS